MYVEESENIHEIEKYSFSMMKEPKILNKFEEYAKLRGTKDVFLYGVFTEVCVL